MSQERAVPVILKEDWMRERRMEWLMVSKAAVRSRRMRILTVDSCWRATSLKKQTGAMGARHNHIL